MNKLKVLRRGLSMEFLKSIATYVCVSVGDVLEQMMEEFQNGGESSETKCMADAAAKRMPGSVDMPTHCVVVEDFEHCSYCNLVDALNDIVVAQRKKDEECYFWFAPFCLSASERSVDEYEDHIERVLRTTRACIIYLPSGKVTDPRTVVDAVKVRSMQGGTVTVLGETFSRNDPGNSKGVYASLKKSNLLSFLDVISAGVS